MKLYHNILGTGLKIGQRVKLGDEEPFLVVWANEETVWLYQVRHYTPPPGQPASVFYTQIFDKNTRALPTSLPLKDLQGIAFGLGFNGLPSDVYLSPFSMAYIQETIMTTNCGKYDIDGEELK